MSKCTVTSEPDHYREDIPDLSAAPTAKRPCQCCCQTYSEILSFLEKRSEAEQRLREEEVALRREELEIQRSTFFYKTDIILKGECQNVISLFFLILR